MVHPLFEAASAFCHASISDLRSFEPATPATEFGPQAPAIVRRLAKCFHLISQISAGRTVSLPENVLELQGGSLASITQAAAGVPLLLAWLLPAPLPCRTSCCNGEDFTVTDHKLRATPLCLFGGSRPFHTVCASRHADCPYGLVLVTDWTLQFKSHARVLAINSATPLLSLYEAVQLLAPSLLHQRASSAAIDAALDGASAAISHPAYHADTKPALTACLCGRVLAVADAAPAKLLLSARGRSAVSACSGLAGPLAPNEPVAVVAVELDVESETEASAECPLREHSASMDDDDDTDGIGGADATRACSTRCVVSLLLAGQEACSLWLPLLLPGQRVSFDGVARLPQSSLRWTAAADAAAAVGTAGAAAAASASTAAAHAVGPSKPVWAPVQAAASSSAVVTAAPSAAASGRLPWPLCELSAAGCRHADVEATCFVLRSGMNAAAEHPTRETAASALSALASADSSRAAASAASSAAATMAASSTSSGNSLTPTEMLRRWLVFVQHIAFSAGSKTPAAARSAGSALGAAAGPEPAAVAMRDRLATIRARASATAAAWHAAIAGASGLGSTSGAGAALSDSSSATAAVAAAGSSPADLRPRLPLTICSTLYSGSPSFSGASTSTASLLPAVAASCAASLSRPCDWRTVSYDGLLTDVAADALALDGLSESSASLPAGATQSSSAYKPPLPLWVPPSSMPFLLWLLEQGASASQLPLLAGDGRLARAPPARIIASHVLPLYDCCGAVQGFRYLPSVSSVRVLQWLAPPPTVNGTLKPLLPPAGSAFPGAALSPEQAQQLRSWATRTAVELAAACERLAAKADDADAADARDSCTGSAGEVIRSDDAATQATSVHERAVALRRAVAVTAAMLVPELLARSSGADGGRAVAGRSAPAPASASTSGPSSSAPASASTSTTGMAPRLQQLQDAIAGLLSCVDSTPAAAVPASSGANLLHWLHALLRGFRRPCAVPALSVQDVQTLARTASQAAITALHAALRRVDPWSRTCAQDASAVRSGLAYLTAAVRAAVRAALASDGVSDASVQVALGQSLMRLQIGLHCCAGPSSCARTWGAAGARCCTGPLLLLLRQASDTSSQRASAPAVSAAADMPASGSVSSAPRHADHHKLGLIACRSIALTMDLLTVPVSPTQPSPNAVTAATASSGAAVATGSRPELAADAARELTPAVVQQPAAAAAFGFERWLEAAVMKPLAAATTSSCDGARPASAMAPRLDADYAAAGGGADDAAWTTCFSAADAIGPPESVGATGVGIHCCPADISSARRIAVMRSRSWAPLPQRHSAEKLPSSRMHLWRWQVSGHVVGSWQSSGAAEAAESAVITAVPSRPAHSAAVSGGSSDRTAVHSRAAASAGPLPAPLTRVLSELLVARGSLPFAMTVRTCLSNIGSLWSEPWERQRLPLGKPSRGSRSAAAASTASSAGAGAAAPALTGTPPIIAVIGTLVSLELVTDSGASLHHRGTGRLELKLRLAHCEAAARALRGAYAAAEASSSLISSSDDSAVWPPVVPADAETVDVFIPTDLEVWKAAPAQVHGIAAPMPMSASSAAGAGAGAGATAGAAVDSAAESAAAKRLRVASNDRLLTAIARLLQPGVGPGALVVISGLQRHVAKDLQRIMLRGRLTGTRVTAAGGGAAAGGAAGSILDAVAALPATASSPQLHAVATVQQLLRWARGAGVATSMPAAAHEASLPPPAIVLEALAGCAAADASTTTSRTSGGSSHRGISSLSMLRPGLEPLLRGLQEAVLPPQRHTLAAAQLPDAVGDAHFRVRGRLSQLVVVRLKWVCSLTGAALVLQPPSVTAARAMAAAAAASLEQGHELALSPWLRYPHYELRVPISFPVAAAHDGATGGQRGAGTQNDAVFSTAVGLFLRFMLAADANALRIAQPSMWRSAGAGPTSSLPAAAATHAATAAVSSIVSIAGAEEIPIFNTVPAAAALAAARSAASKGAAGAAASVSATSSASASSEAGAASPQLQRMLKRARTRWLAADGDDALPSDWAAAAAAAPRQAPAASAKLHADGDAAPGESVGAASSASSASASRSTPGAHATRPALSLPPPAPPALRLEIDAVIDDGSGEGKLTHADVFAGPRLEALFAELCGLLRPHMRLPLINAATPASSVAASADAVNTGAGAGAVSGAQAVGPPAIKRARFTESNEGAAATRSAPAPAGLSTTAHGSINGSAVARSTSAAAAAPAPAAAAGAGLRGKHFFADAVLRRRHADSRSLPLPPAFGRPHSLPHHSANGGVCNVCAATRGAVQEDPASCLAMQLLQLPRCRLAFWGVQAAIHGSLTQMFNAVGSHAAAAAAAADAYASSSSSSAAGAAPVFGPDGYRVREEKTWGGLIVSAEAACRMRTPSARVAMPDGLINVKSRALDERLPHGSDIICGSCGCLMISAGIAATAPPAVSEIPSASLPLLEALPPQIVHSFADSAAAATEMFRELDQRATVLPGPVRCAGIAADGLSMSGAGGTEGSGGWVSARLSDAAAASLGHSFASATTARRHGEGTMWEFTVQRVWPKSATDSSAQDLQRQNVAAEPDGVWLSRRVRSRWSEPVTELITAVAEQVMAASGAVPAAAFASSATVGAISASSVPRGTGSSVQVLVPPAPTLMPRSTSAAAGSSNNLSSAGSSVCLPKSASVAAIFVDAASTVASSTVQAARVPSLQLPRVQLNLLKAEGVTTEQVLQESLGALSELDLEK